MFYISALARSVIMYHGSKTTALLTACTTTDYANYDQGVDAYWLDETDGEGTGGGGDGDYGYNTSYGPPNAYSQLWVNDWLSMYVTRYATATACKY